MRLWKTKPKAEPLAFHPSIQALLDDTPVIDPPKTENGAVLENVVVSDNRGFDYRIFKVPKGATMPNMRRLTDAD